MRIITLDSNNKVTDVKDVGESYTDVPGLQPGEIISNTGEKGQIMQADGTFITPTPASITPEPTIEDKVNYLYYKSKGVIS